jgi:hypothetical protein
MGAELKPVGRAVATAKGHYPGADGRHATVLPGETFTVFEGRDKAKWFTLLKADEPAPAPVVAPAPAPEPDTLAAAAGAERKRKASAKAPLADDIA